MRKPYQPALKIRSSEITDKGVWRQRRTLLKASAALGLSGSIGAQYAIAGNKLTQPVTKSPFSTTDELTAQDTATSYNNFYELGTNKGDPVKNADQLKTDPWSVTVEGECAKPGEYTLEDILKPHGIEERIYRHRCVEAWSMVIPWNGFSLGDLLKRFEPNGNAKYVGFETIFDPDRLVGQRSRVLDWPYTEGLRMDEAMHPLAMIAIGMYGEEIPSQNGAPMRLVVPWKYGFKGIKSIVKIKFTDKEPATSWNRSAPHEYGFYSNVNPEVSHPRWSQAKERRLVGESGGLSALFTPKVETQMLNGYSEEVGSLYSDMDLAKFF